MTAFDLMIVYAVGTMLGMLFGARWAYTHGIAAGISGTLVELKRHNLLNDDYKKHADIVKILASKEQN